jgi:hypothetical protein
MSDKKIPVKLPPPPVEPLPRGTISPPSFFHYQNLNDKDLKRAIRTPRGMNYADRVYIAPQVFDRKADPKLWGLMANWTTEQANALLLGLDPHFVSWGLVDAIKEDAEHPLLDCYLRLHQLLISEWGYAPKLCRSPMEFIAWADRTDIQVPKRLRKIAKMQYDKAKIEVAPTGFKRENKVATLPEQVKAKAATWYLKELQRAQGYAVPLYELLKAAHDRGESCPSAADVLKHWRDSPPAGYGIEVKPNLREMTYHGGGKQPMRIATAAAISDAIRRRTKLCKAR